MARRPKLLNSFDRAGKLEKTPDYSPETPEATPIRSEALARDSKFLKDQMARAQT